MRFFSLSIFIFLAFKCHSQEKIDGLGPFKIGKTLCSKIPTFADTSKGRLYYAKPLYENTEQWFAGYYPISGLWIENLELSFYHDTLYSIKCNVTLDIIKALKTKYGNPKIEEKTKVYHCRSGLKIDYTEIAKSYFSQYPTAAKNIIAQQAQIEYYDDNCNKQNSSSFEIYNNSISRRVYSEMAKIEERKLKSSDTLTKKKLKDF